jgi:hypothetical protein
MNTESRGTIGAPWRAVAAAAPAMTAARLGRSTPLPPKVSEQTFTFDEIAGATGATPLDHESSGGRTSCSGRRAS